MTVKSAICLINILYVSRELCDLGDKYSAMVFVDECHATGLMGKTGRYIKGHSRSPCRQKNAHNFSLK